MEWRLRVRFDRIYAPERKYMASRNRRHSLLARHAFPYVGAPAFSERDLARVCAARVKLSLFGDPSMSCHSLVGASKSRPTRLSKKLHSLLSSIRRIISN